MNKSVNVQRVNHSYSTFGGSRCNFHSLDFGQISPCMCDEVLGSDTWRFNIKNSLEIAPLAVKTRNDVFYNQSAFFVSGRQLDDSYSDIITGKVKRNGSPVPHLLTFNYLHMFNEILNDIRWAWTNPAKFLLTQSALNNRGLFDLGGSSVTFTAVGSGTADYNELLKIVKSYMSQYSKDINIVVLLPIAAGELEYKFIPIFLSYTKKGQALRKIFDGLGYKMPLLIADHTDSVANPLPATFTNKSPKFVFGGETPTSTSFTALNGSPCVVQANAYPLLAYLKVINDFFVMSSVQDDNPISLYLDSVRKRVFTYVSPFGADSDEVQSDKLLTALLQVSLQLHSDDVTRMTRNYYDNYNPFYTRTTDFETFVTAAPTPQTTQPGCVMLNGSSNTIPAGAQQVYGYNDRQVGGTSDYVVCNDSTTSYFSQKIVDATHRMLQVAKLSGSKAASRLRTFFGVSDPIDDSLHCLRVASSTMPLQVNGVLINSNTYNGSSVDDDAGTKIAVANGGGKVVFTFTNGREHGYGVVLHWLSVRTVYANRTPRYVLKTHLMDLYNGMYDGQGFAQSVGQMEVNTDYTDPSKHYCFGTQPLFEEYRNLSVDYMSGDVYRVKGLRSYLIPRDFRNILNGSELYAEFSSVRSVRQSTDEFGDMWIAKDGYDPILVFQDVNVTATRHVQDSVHALGLSTGDMNVEIQHNMA